ncbi:hypothetical protein V6N13_048475 [Hibiscus sabdariffa]
MSGTFSDLSIAWKSSQRSRIQCLGYLPNLISQRFEYSFLVLHPHLSSVHQGINFLDELARPCHISRDFALAGIDIPANLKCWDSGYYSVGFWVLPTFRRIMVAATYFTERIHYLHFLNVGLLLHILDHVGYGRNLGKNSVKRIQLSSSLPH